MINWTRFKYPNLLSIIFVLIILTLVRYLHFSNYVENNTNITKVILVKLPRSGSTWFTEILNNIPNVYISKEIIQHKDVGRYSTREIEDHLITALTKPTGKLSDRYSILPGSRMFKDYYFHESLKIFNGLKVLGVSINLEHAENIDWSRICNIVPNLTILVLYRINMIKSAISGFNGKVLHSSCGVNNIYKASIEKTNSGRCNITAILNSRVDWNRENFVIEINKWITRYKRFWDRLEQNAILKRIRKQYITYEEIQSNATKAIIRILPFFGLLPSNRYSRHIYHDINFIKRTDENLRNVLLNYDDIHAALSRHKKCGCLLAQLIASGPKYDILCESQLMTYEFRTNDIICV